VPVQCAVDQCGEQRERSSEKDEFHDVTLPCACGETPVHRRAFLSIVHARRPTCEKAKASR
jgi:hypothetical protein